MSDTETMTTPGGEEGPGSQSDAEGLSSEVAAERQLFGRLRKIVYEMDVDGRLTGVNDYTARLLGYPAQELVSNPNLFQQLIHPADQPQVTNYLEDLRQLGGEVEFDYRIKPADQVATLRDNEGYIWLRNTALSKAKADGKMIGIFGTMDDITDLKLTAAIDDLTKTFRREVFLEIAEKALIAAQRNNTHAAMLLVDLDEFKLINDAYGHLAGDIALKEIAARLKSQIRPGDTLGRLGGDEFGVFLPSITRRNMGKVGNRLLKATEHPINIGRDAHVNVGLSIGVRLTEDGFGTASDLLSGADSAMYQAKNSGNHIVIWKPGMDIR